MNYSECQEILSEEVRLRASYPVEGWAWAPSTALRLLPASQMGEPEAGVCALQREAKWGARTRPAREWASSREGEARGQRAGSDGELSLPPSLLPSSLGPVLIRCPPHPLE